MNDPSPTNTDARSRDRSPQFPFIDLKKAIERAREFEAEYKKSAGRIANALQVWKYTSKSSSGQQTIGALLAFGLLEDEGSGAERKVKLTDLAQRILKDERPGKREEAIREAALKPKALAERWAAWRTGRPPDIECRSELTLERGYTEDAANRFIQVYDDTLSFAKIGLADKKTDKLLGELEGPTFKVGDLVQWESAGVLQFPLPRRVTEILGSGEFVMVEGSNTGVPTKELTLVPPSVDTKIEPSAGALGLSGAAPRVAASAMRQDVWNLDEGPVVLQYPVKMSAASYQDFEDWINLQLKKIKRGSDQGS